MAVEIVLGAEADVRSLYSYPNNFNEVGFLEQTLEETIERWILSSIRRDGFHDSSARAVRRNGNVSLEIDGSAAGHYGDKIVDLLAAGRLALEGSRNLNAAKRWQYNWRFLLPHGVAMLRHKTVQLLHFPPDYVLERDQDYLSAHTTTRWAELLVENGAQPDQTASYQAIIDIAPIAAPSDAGASLEGVYAEYTPFIQALFRSWLPVGKSARPMVAFGSPVRSWLKSVFDVDVPVLTTTKVSIAGLSVPVLGANHPSFIYNAVKRMKDDPGTPEDERIVKAMRIMQDDLVAAAWQVRMAAAPQSDPVAVLESCKSHWSKPERQRRICELTYSQALNKSSDEAKKLCAKLPSKLAAPLSVPKQELQYAIDREIDDLRRELGPLDGREPDRIPEI